MYALEMMSAGVGRHHAITTLVIDSKIWVFYYDRQCIIQTDGFDFVDEPPRFLVLLFAFQRFNLNDWGILDVLDAQAVQVHKADIELQPGHYQTRENPRSRSIARKERVPSVQFDLTDLMNGEVNPPDKITIDLSDPIQRAHTIGGRATSVMAAKADNIEPELVFKLYNPQIERTNEGDIMRHAYQITNAHNPAMATHLPQMLAYGDIPGCLTNRIRSMLKQPWKVYRTTRFLVLVKLKKLTTLCGPQFIQAWFEIVKCHAFLWSHGLCHGDPSLWNVMCDANGAGVLCDFDLAVLQSARHPATERTGTIPFMSIQLLTDEYWNGKIERQYHHELEAFIWILPFVFSRYPKADGKSIPGSDTDAWLTSDYKRCRQEKLDFLETILETIFKAVSDSEPVKPYPTEWKSEWFIAYLALDWVRNNSQRLREKAHKAMLAQRKQGKTVQKAPTVHETLASFIAEFEADDGGYKDLLDNFASGYSYDYVAGALDGLRSIRPPTKLRAEDKFT